MGLQYPHGNLGSSAKGYLEVAGGKHMLPMMCLLLNMLKHVETHICLEKKIWCRMFIQNIST